MTKRKITCWVFCWLFASLCIGPAFAADATVAPNGDGQFKSIHEAIMAAPQGLPSATRPWVIHVKPGVYKELIYVQQERRFIKLEGEDAQTTIITMNLHANLPGPDGKPIGTFRTPTVQIDGDGFSAENITFENSAGPVGQALALRVDADKVSFKNCRFLGWQDTILTNRGRHYFENCYIAGHVDFIFGAATVWFEKCQIHCLRSGYITAASTPAEHPFGYVFSNCKITGEPEVKTYLGRPWRGFASTIFLNTEMSEVVRSEGWHNWTGPEREKTARYAEYKSTGAGANDAARVQWARQLSDIEANAITLEKVLGDWNPKAPSKTAAAVAEVARVQAFLIGDSTMADKPLADNPERGWGQLLPTYFDDRVIIKNHAMNGRSTKSFIDEGRWTTVLQQLNKGDWVFIQFGHNDEKKEDPKRYAAPQTDYKTNLTRFVNEARSKGATPILLTPVMRRRFDAQWKFFDTHGEYPDAVRTLAKELNVTLIDMHQSSQKLIEQLGVDESKKLFLHIAPGAYKSLPNGKQDDTHFSEYGARQMAGLVTSYLHQQRLSLASYLKTQVTEPPLEWVDSDTGHRVVRLSREAGTASLYFHQNAYSPDGQKLIATTPSGLATIHLKTRAIEQIVAGRVNVIVTGRKSGLVYYVKDRAVFATHLETKATREIAKLPPRGSVASVNADETLLLGSMIEGDAQSSYLQGSAPDAARPTPPEMRGPQGQTLTFAEQKEVRLNTRLEQRLPMALFTVNTQTGELKIIHRATDWLNHLQFSPTDPNQIMFCHEGPWHKVDRIWTMRLNEKGDGTKPTKIHTRTMNMEIAGHEFFSADGKTIWYDLQTPRGEDFWVAGYEIATGARTWYHLQRDEWSVHFNVSLDGKLFAGDGGDDEMVAHAKNGKWIYLFRPEGIPDVAGIKAPNAKDLIVPGFFKGERLVNMRKHDYRLEPNVTFTPDLKWLIFRSNMHGATHVYAVEVKKQ